MPTPCSGTSMTDSGRTSGGTWIRTILSVMITRCPPQDAHGKSHTRPMPPHSWHDSTRGKPMGTSTPRTASSGVRMSSKVSPSGRSALGIPMPVKFRKMRSTSASRDGRTARGSAKSDLAPSALARPSGHVLGRVGALPTWPARCRGAAARAGLRAPRTPRSLFERRSCSASPPRPGGACAQGHDTVRVFPPDSPTATPPGSDSSFSGPSSTSRSVTISPRRRPWSVRPDLDLSRFGLFGLRQAQMEDPVLQRRLDLCLVDRL